MTGLVRKVALLSGCSLIMAAGAAFAGIPDAGQSTLTSPNATGTVPNPITTIPVSYWTAAGGPGAGTPVELSRPGPTLRRITVKDFSGNPISGALVKISYGECCDVELCSATGQAGVTADIVNHIVSGFTNAGGQFDFIVVGAAQNVKSSTNPAPATLQNGCVPGVTVLNPSLKTVKVFANVGTGDILIKQPTSYVFNADGSAVGGLGTSGGGVTFSAADAGRVFNDSFVGGLSRGRDDFNHNGVITAGDSSLPFQEFLLGSAGATTNCGAGNTVGDRVATCP